MSKYRYQVKGLAADGQTWNVEGDILTVSAGDFSVALDRAMVSAFNALTHGKAVFGKPGVGCRGPYTITSFSVILKDSK